MRGAAARIDRDSEGTEAIYHAPYWTVLQLTCQQGRPGGWSGGLAMLGAGGARLQAYHGQRGDHQSQGDEDLHDGQYSTEAGAGPEQ